MADVDVRLIRQQLDRIESAQREADKGLATGGSGPHNPGGMEPRVAKLEADVAHIRSDIGEIKGLLNRLAPRIDEMYGRQSSIATTTNLAELRLEVEKRPTRRQTIFDIFAIVSLIGALLAIGSHMAH